MEENIIPIFPLPLVVCPGEPLPLNIFEERYKVLLKDCFDQESKSSKQPFGISYLENKHLSDIGCMVEIKTILNTFPGGQSEIITIGTRRYRMIETILPDENTPYLKARVKLLNDLDILIDTNLEKELNELYQKIASIYKFECQPVSQPMSYSIAFLCQIENGPKQLLLESDNENERMKILIHLFRKIIKSKEVNRRVKSNGHFKNGQIDVM